MIEIRFHGRGGQGAVVASKILADAAFHEGKDVQSFPFFGVERRGAPVTAFARIDSKRIRLKSMIYNPDIVVVLDSTLLDAVSVTAGLKEGGIVLVNSDKSPEELGIKHARVAAVDATGIAVRYGLGSRASPIVNTAILGAFAKVSGLVSINAIVDAIMSEAPSKKEANAEAAREAYNTTVMQWK
jgi:2-oxoacid:acceptor oxidoreductase gamma subunit (pyruvate/2-ketoisovalerate family)